MTQGEMTQEPRTTLDLPNGESVTPDDVFLFNDYPYRFVPLEHPEYDFKLAPLYWGDSDMDVPFPDVDAFDEQWGPESAGTLTEDEWRAWLEEARLDDRFGDDEVDALARELLPADGVVAHVRRTLGI